MARTTPDNIILAQISAVVRRATATGVISNQARAAAVAELCQLARHRPDLLAQEAGLSLGFAEADRDLIPGRGQMQAELCVLAGADPDLIQHWRHEGYSRAFASTHIPRTW
jgi:hypothetical protein